MKRGIVDITNVMRGSTQVTKVMRGTTLIWESGGSGLVDNINLVNSTSNSVRLSWLASPSFTYYSIRRNGVEVYRGTEVGYVDYLLDPSTSYNYSVYGHDGIGGAAQGTGDIFPFSTTALYGVTYAETTAYMNEIAVPNDSTIYWSGTAQEITGAEVWSGINEIVHFFKTNSVWDMLVFWQPSFGSTQAMCGVNITDVNNYTLTFSGTWNINSIGLQGNRTDGKAEWVRSDAALVRASNMDLYNAGLGYVYHEDGTNASTEIEMGLAVAADARFFLCAHIGAYGGALQGYNTTLSAVNLSKQKGSYSTMRSTKAWMVVNGEVKKTLDSAGSGSYGGIYEYQLQFGKLGVDPGADPTNYRSDKRISNPYLMHNITDVSDQIVINNGIEMWQKYLKRKTW